MTYVRSLLLSLGILGASIGNSFGGGSASALNHIFSIANFNRSIHGLCVLIAYEINGDDKMREIEYVVKQGELFHIDLLDQFPDAEVIRVHMISIAQLKNTPKDSSSIRELQKLVLSFETHIFLTAYSNLLSNL